MAIKTYTELSVEAQLIADETVAGENTAERIGDTLQDIIDSSEAGAKKVYKALLSYNGTTLTANVVYNTLGETPTFTSSTAGTLQIDSANLVFVKLKTIAICGGQLVSSSVPYIITTSTSASNNYVRFFIKNIDGTTPSSTPIFTYLPISIEVYE